jgi:hypothetical protein
MVNGKREKATNFQTDCNHTLRHTLDWMHKQEIVEIRDNIEKIYDLGGHCDCEVLLNVPPRTWKKERTEPIESPDYYMDWAEDPQKEWVEMIDQALAQATA